MMNDFQVIHDLVAEEKAKLINIAREIHHRPELGGKEFFAVELITAYLEKHNFSVKRGIGGLETAFIASRGEEGYHIAFCSEYDALPAIGHGCGHNLIGIAGVTAGIALAACLGQLAGRISVIGTPNEEGEGGKVDLVRAGIFADVDAAMMFHPGCSTRIDVQSLACTDYNFIFHGRSAHASCEPWEGRNALDAVILTFNAINALRQHLKEDVRIHGIITEGGLAVNIVPERAAAQFCIRAKDNLYLETVVEKVKKCARGAALTTGTELEIKSSGHPYDAMTSNQTMAAVFSGSLDEAGYSIKSELEEGLGSIDMGNVSRVVPSIHPVLAITDKWLPGHTPEFTAFCDTEQAYEVMLAAGRAMAITGLKILQDPVLQQKIKEEFTAQKKKNKASFKKDVSSD